LAEKTTNYLEIYLERLFAHIKANPTSLDVKKIHLSYTQRKGTKSVSGAGKRLDYTL